MVSSGAMAWAQIVSVLCFGGLPTIACLVGLVFLWLRVRRGKPREPGCGACGYQVQSLSTFSCPECGADLRVVGISQAFRPMLHPVLFILFWTLLLPIPSCTVGSIGIAVGPKTSHVMHNMTLVVPNGQAIQQIDVHTNPMAGLMSNWIGAMAGGGRGMTGLGDLTVMISPQHGAAHVLSATTQPNVTTPQGSQTPSPSPTPTPTPTPTSAPSSGNWMVLIIDTQQMQMMMPGQMMVNPNSGQPTVMQGVAVTQANLLHELGNAGYNTQDAEVISAVADLEKLIAGYPTQGLATANLSFLSVQSQFSHPMDMPKVWWVIVVLLLILATWIGGIVLFFVIHRQQQRAKKMHLSRYRAAGGAGGASGSGAAQAMPFPSPSPSPDWANVNPLDDPPSGPGSA